MAELVGRNDRGNESVCTCTPTQRDKQSTGNFKGKVNQDKLTNGQEANAVVGNLPGVGRSGRNTAVGSAVWCVGCDAMKLNRYRVR